MKINYKSVLLMIALLMVPLKAFALNDNANKAINSQLDRLRIENQKNRASSFRNRKNTIEDSDLLGEWELLDSNNNELARINIQKIDKIKEGRIFEYTQVPQPSHNKARFNTERRDSVIGIIADNKAIFTYRKDLETNNFIVADLSGSTNVAQVSTLNEHDCKEANINEIPLRSPTEDLGTNAFLCDTFVNGIFTSSSLTDAIFHKVGTTIETPNQTNLNDKSLNKARKKLLGSWKIKNFSSDALSRFFEITEVNSSPLGIQFTYQEKVTATSPLTSGSRSGFLLGNTIITVFPTLLFDDFYTYDLKKKHSIEIFQRHNECFRTTLEDFSFACSFNEIPRASLHTEITKFRKSKK